MSKSMLPGEVDGYQEVAQAIRAMSEICDIRTLNIGASADEDISIATVFGAGYFAKIFVNTTVADGDILVKTSLNGEGGYVTVPVASKMSTGVLPRITHVKKTGSVATVNVYLQRINQ